MTIARRDGGGTKFSNWLRNDAPQPKDGFVLFDVDYVWENYHQHKWMLIEEKTYKADMSKCQYKQIERRHKINKKGDGGKGRYYGYHIIQFEKESPEDGKIWLDRQEVSKERLMAFLRFEDVDVDSFNKLNGRSSII